MVDLPDGYEWLEIEKDISEEDHAQVVKIQTSHYYDPVLYAPVDMFLGVCRYLHKHAFKVEHEFYRMGVVEKDVKGGHSVVITAGDLKTDSGYRFPFSSLRVVQG